MKIPKGRLILIGGREAKEEDENQDREENIDFNNGVLKEVISGMKGRTPVIEVIPLASDHQKEMIRTYRKAFRKLGHKIDAMIIGEDEDVDDEKNLEKLMKADGVFFTGGDQQRLKERLEGTKFVEIIRDRYYNDDFVIAGTSAGAMIMSEFMINRGGSGESLLKGIADITAGFGFLPGTIIDTHFLNRGRITRLIAALLQRKKLTGIGISEDNAVVITGGNEMRGIGSGTVTIIETDQIKRTNYNEVKEKDPVFVENLKIHILASGASYLIKEKKFRVLTSDTVVR